MKNILAIFSENTSEALSYTLLHSLWQSTLLLGIYLCLCKLVKFSSATKYNLGVCFLVMQFFVSIITFNKEYYVIDVVRMQSIVPILGEMKNADLSSFSKQGTGFFEDFKGFITNNVHFLVDIWIIGLCLLLSRFAYNFRAINTLKKSKMTPIDNTIEMLNALLSKMKTGKTIQLFESAKTNVPIVVGHLKPIILIPVGLFSSLSYQEMEAILAHEMAHIQRNDYLVNLFQVFVEIIYFFNPAIQYLSEHVRVERENACDDFACQMTGNKIHIAKALLKVETYRQEPSLAMAFGRKSNKLSARVIRILKGKNKETISFKALIASFIALFIGIIFYGKNNILAQQITPKAKENLSNKHVSTSKPVKIYFGTNNDNTMPLIEINNNHEKLVLAVSKTGGTVFINGKAVKLSVSDSVKMVEHNAELKKLNEKLTSYSSKMSDLGSQMGKLATEMAEKNEPIAVQSQALASLSQKVASISQKQASLSQSMAGLDPSKNKKRLLEIEKQEKAYDKQIENLEVQMNKLEAEIEKLSETEEQNSAPMDSLQNEMDKLETPISNLTNEIQKHQEASFKLFPKEAVIAYNRITKNNFSETINLPTPPPPPPPPPARMLAKGRYLPIPPPPPEPPRLGLDGKFPRLPALPSLRRHKNRH